MATTLQQTEAAPEAYPDPPEGLSTAAAALDAAMIWQRIEAYTAWRFTEREVTWIAEGPGEWLPPLHVAVVDTTERWTGTAWEIVTDLQLSPLGGYMLPGCGPYRIVATVGDGGDPPASVMQAFTRLAEYMAADRGKAGARTETVTIDELRTESIQRSASWMGAAMQNSGAADLLRGFRRVPC